VWFSYINSNVVKQDEFGFLTLFIVLPSILIALIISTLTGIILSIKRKSREDFDYNIKRLSWIFSILLVLFIFFSIYDFLISSIAISTSTKVVCYLRIGENRANDCLLKIATEESATEEITCGELDNKKDRNDCYRWTAQNRGDIKICIDNAEAETEVLIYNDICSSAIRDLDEYIYSILENPKHQDIMYAIKSVEYSLGICYGDERKAIPLLKNIVLQGNLESKQEALNILIDNAYCLGGNTLEGEKEFLRNNVLPLIQNQTGLQDYVNKINMVLSSKTLEPSEIEVNPDSKTAPKL